MPFIALTLHVRVTVATKEIVTLPLIFRQLKDMG
jgi:hypothetical protein